jgi:hypothetical protein
VVLIFHQALTHCFPNLSNCRGLSMKVQEQVRALGNYNPNQQV